MDQATIDKQSVLHCPNCGGSFFEQNGINRISLASALDLTRKKKSDEISGDKKFCPRDQAQLEILPHSEESIPSEVTLLRCPTCRGIFAFPDDLVSFKKAQEAKVNYFSLWHFPLSSIKTIVILSVVVFFSALFFTASLYSRPGEKTQAQDIIRNSYISRSGVYMFFSFQTTKPMRSRLSIEDKTTDSVIMKNIATKPQTMHTLTVSGLILQDELYYQIILIDTQGREIKTEWKRLNVQ